MAINQAIAPATAPNLSLSFIRVLSLPWLDRTIAAMACVPLVYLAYYRYEHWHHGFPLIASALNVLILVVTMKSNGTTNLIAVLGLLIVIWARFSLGRNIGFVPAQRQLVHSGAYAYMRHPVYTGGFLTSLAFLLRAYSPQNALWIGLGIFWFIPVKSLVEEDFLRSDPQYAGYMKEVRARWIPFLV